MKVVKLNSLLAAVLIAISVLSSCRKETVKPPVEQEEPQEVSMLGYWEGAYGLGNDEPTFYFALKIKNETELIVVDADKNILGTGTWVLEDELFTAQYSFNETPNLINSLAAKYDKDARRLSGSWGLGLDPSSGAFYVEQE